MHQKKLWKVPWMRKDDKETKIYLKCMYVMYLFIFIFLLVIVTISRFIASLPLIEVFLKRNTCTVSTLFICTRHSWTICATCSTHRNDANCVRICRLSLQNRAMALVLWINMTNVKQVGCKAFNRNSCRVAEWRRKMAGISSLVMSSCDSWHSPGALAFWPWISLTRPHPLGKNMQILCIFGESPSDSVVSGYSSLFRIKFF